MSLLSLDAYPSLQAALDAIPEGSRGAVTIPPGRWQQEGPAVAKNKSVSLIGYGKGVSELVFPREGISYHSEDLKDTLNVSDLSITTTSPNAGAALSASWADTGSSTYQNATLKNVAVRGDDIHQHFFTRGLVLSGAWNSKAWDYDFQGLYGETVPGVIAYELTERTIDPQFSNCHAYFCDVGMHVSGMVEGVHISDSTFVFMRGGLVSNTDIARGAIFVHDSHFATDEFGLKLYGRHESQVSGCLLFKWPSSTDNYVGVDLLNSPKSRIVNNHFKNAAAMDGSDPALDTCVLVRGSSPKTDVSHNGFEFFETGTWLQSGTYGCVATENRRLGGRVTVVDSGTGNVVRNL